MINKKWSVFIHFFSGCDSLAVNFWLNQAISTPNLRVCFVHQIFVQHRWDLQKYLLKGATHHLQTSYGFFFQTQKGCLKKSGIFLAWNFWQILQTKSGRTQQLHSTRRWWSYPVVRANLYHMLPCCWYSIRAKRLSFQKQWHEICWKTVRISRMSMNKVSWRIACKNQDFGTSNTKHTSSKKITQKKNLAAPLSL